MKAKQITEKEKTSNVSEIDFWLRYNGQENQITEYISLQIKNEQFSITLGEVFGNSFREGKWVNQEEKQTTISEIESGQNFDDGKN